MKTQNRPELKVIIDGIEYEPKPKPLLADAKVGDLVKRRDGHWAQIIETSGGVEFQPIEYLHNKRLIAVTINGSYTVYNDYMQDDIVEYQPLAPEGSAEWAWQMLNLLGLPIYHPAEGVLTIPVPYSSERFAHCYAKTGWQIHEPEPEPAKEPEYKVGDFIKDGGNYYIVTSPTTCVGLLNGKGYEICPKTGKIVFPSEEVLDFGNGVKGTVRSCEYDSGCVRVIYGDRVIAHIVTDILEKPMRDLVERLLIAQEEK